MLLYWDQGEFLAPDEDLSSENHHANPRLRRRASLPSIMFTESPVAHPATLPLKGFCDLIGRYPSLERANIRRVECYKEKVAPKHRFLIFHCVRSSRCPVWFRVDRRIQGGVSKLFFSKGLPNAEDTVRFSLNVGDSFTDNYPPPLQDTNRCEQNRSAWQDVPRARK